MAKLKKVLQYIRNNKTWSQAEEDLAWECIGNKEPIPYSMNDQIADLLDDYGLDHGLSDDWWSDLDLEEIFTQL